MKQILLILTILFLQLCNFAYAKSTAILDTVTISNPDKIESNNAFKVTYTIIFNYVTDKEYQRMCKDTSANLKLSYDAKTFKLTIYKTIIEIANSEDDARKSAKEGLDDLKQWAISFVTGESRKSAY